MLGEDYNQWRQAPDQLTTAEAARLTGRSSATIRQWAARGYLTAAGRRGKSLLYDRHDVRRVLEQVEGRTHLPPFGQQSYGLGQPRLRSKDLDAIVTGKEAAAIARVAPTTIRAWVARDHLKPLAARPGTPSMYHVVDVLAAARRLLRPDF